MSYETIVVDENDTFTKSLSNGETWGNVMIDISANGAHALITARGSNMTVQNVAIVGGWDHEPSSSAPIQVEADAGSTVRIENVYIDAGETAGNFDPDQDPTGIYTYWSHAGTLEIDRIHLRNFPDNGIYASPPGNPSEHPNEGSNGEVHVTNCYTYDCHTSGIRLGTDGSYAENCVIVGGDHRGFWGYYNHTELINCDILTGGDRDIQIGGSADWDGHDTAEVTVTNTRFDSYLEHQPDNELHGSSAGSPVHRSPSDLGAPETAEEAASGSAGSWEYELDYDEHASPGDAYDLLSGSSNWSFVSDPTYTGSTALELDWGQDGQHGNAWIEPGEHAALDTNEHGHANELWQQAYLYIPDDFDLGSSAARFWVSAISYSAGDGHSGGGTGDGTNGWSARCELMQEGPDSFGIAEWCYHIGDTTYNYYDETALERGWNEIRSYVRVNSYSGGTATADGETALWVNGEQVYHHTDWEFTTEPDNEIEYAGFAGYWNNASDTDLYWDAHRVSTSDPGEDTDPEESTFTGPRLTSASTQNEGRTILHESDGFQRGNTYEAEIEFSQSFGADVGILFGSTQESVSWDSYTGYLAFLDTGDDEIRVDRWSNGSQQASEASPWPVSAKAYRLLIDYGDSEADEITFSALDYEEGTVEGEVTLTDTVHDDGYAGFYRHHAGDDWVINAIAPEGEVDEPPVEEHDVTMTATVEDVTAVEDVEMVLEFDSADEHTYGLDIVAEVGGELEWEPDGEVTDTATYTFTFEKDVGTHAWSADVWVLDDEGDRIDPDLEESGTVTVGEPEAETGQGFINHGDGEGEREMTAIETPYGTVTAGFVNHGDGEGEQQFWPAEAEPQVLVIDDFGDGDFRSEWEHTENYTVIEDANATAGYAAHRTTNSRLWMPDGAAERQPEQGDWIVVWTTNVGADGGPTNAHQFIFGADGDLNDWPDRVECNSNAFDDGELEIRHNGDTLSTVDVDGGWPTDEYVTNVAHWERDGTLHFWAYDESETELGYLVEELDHPESYGDWGPNPNSTSDDLRIGTIEMHEYHPVTGHRFTATPYEDIELIVDVPNTVEGDPVSVDVELYSDPNTSYSGDIEVTVANETQTDTWEVTAGTTITHTFEFDALEAGEHAWSVDVTPGPSESGELTVYEHDPTTPVATETETVMGGQSETGTLTWEAEHGMVDAWIARVETLDDVDTEPIEIVEGEEPPPPEPEVDVIDTFADGTFDDGWEVVGEAWETVEDSRAVDGWAAYRGEETAADDSQWLVGDETGWDETPGPGVYTVIRFEFRDTDSSWQFPIMAEFEDTWDGNRVEFLADTDSIGLRGGGGQTIGTESATLPTDEYLTGVGYVQTLDEVDDDEPRVAEWWVYDSDDNLLGHVSGEID